MCPVQWQTGVMAMTQMLPTLRTPQMTAVSSEKAALVAQWVKQHNTLRTRIPIPKIEVMQLTCVTCHILWVSI